jgi:collagenase-like PrtC family protease
MFKIGGRTHFVEWTLNNVNAYYNESYDGNLLDLLDSIKDLKDTFYVANRDLEGAIEQWKKCDKNCHKCGYCKRLAEDIIKIQTEDGNKKLSSIRNPEDIS